MSPRRVIEMPPPPWVRQRIEELRQLEAPAELLNDVLHEVDETDQVRPPGILRMAAGLTAAAAVAAAVTLIALGTVGPANVGSPSPLPSPSPAPRTSVPAVDSLQDRIVATASIRTDAVSTHHAFGSVWVGGLDGILLRLDPVTLATIARIDIGYQACGPITASTESIWLSTCGRGPGSGVHLAETIRVDPDRNQLANRYADGSTDGFGIAALAGMVWFIADAERGILVAADESTGAELVRVELGEPVRLLTGGASSLWLASNGEVLRVDPNGGEVLARISLGRAGALINHAGAIWVSQPAPGLLARIDPASDQVVADLEIAAGAGQLAVDGLGRVWVIAGGFAVAIDPASNQEVDRFAVPAHRGPDGLMVHPIAADRDALWWAQRNEVHRLRLP